MMTFLEKKHAYRPTALLVAASLAFPVCFVGCGGKGADTANVPPPVDDSRGSGGRMAPPSPMSTQQTAPPKQGMSTGKKVVIALAGAALLYYLVKHKQKQDNKEVQYYQSKNGRIYYRDPQTHQAHWVTPPPGGYELSDQDQQELSRYKGYNDSSTGEDYNPGYRDTSGAPQ